MYLSTTEKASISTLRNELNTEVFSSLLKSVILKALRLGSREIILTSVIFIKGNVKHSITLDPGIWIFDDRRIDLNTFFTDGLETVDEKEAYLDAAGKHWSREIMEGAVFPPTLKTEKSFEDDEDDIDGTYGMFLNHFLKNAEPLDSATSIIFETKNNTTHTFPLKKLDQFILKFCESGKPLKEQGPAHLLLKDGSNQNDPIKEIMTIIIE